MPPLAAQGMWQIKSERLLKTGQATNQSNKLNHSTIRTSSQEANSQSQIPPMEHSEEDSTHNNHNSLSIQACHTIKHLLTWVTHQCSTDILDGTSTSSTLHKTILTRREDTKK